MFYITFLILLTTLLLRDSIPKKIRFTLTILPLVIIVFFRYGMGADYFSYQHIYQRIVIDSFASLFRYYPEIEIGFKLLMWPFRMLNVPFHVFFVAINMVTLVYILKWIKDNSINFEASVLLFYSMFFFVWVLSAARQGLILALALYYLFNEKKNISFKSKIALIVALTLIHKSALILLAFLVLDKVNWNRKKHILFLVLTLALTLFPLQFVLTPFSNISFISKIMKKYISTSVKLYDFPGLIRLVFYAFVLFFYKLFERNDMKHLADRFLYGIAIYYLFKFSEITASRLTILALFHLVILIPYVVDRYKDHFRYRWVAVPLLFMFSTLYFNKELNTMALQSAYITDGKLVSMETVFNSNIAKFNKKDAFVLSLEKKRDEALKEYTSKTKTQTTYDADKHYQVVENGHRSFRIIDEYGDYLEDYTYTKEVILVDGIVVDSKFYKHHFFANPVLKDLSGKKRSQETMKEIIEESITTNTFKYTLEEKVEVTVNDIPKALGDNYPVKSEIKNVWMSKFSDPFEYYIMRIDYLGQKTYIYLDENKEPMSNLIFNSVAKFDDSLTTSVGIYNKYFIMNRFGDVIWLNQ